MTSNEGRGSRVEGAALAELIAKRDAALKASNEAAALGMKDIAQRHWEEHIRCILQETGEPIPASLMPGETEPKP